MSKVFISYRREDSAGYAQAIHGRLVRHFSKDQLFMDVDTVEPGVDFVRAIEKAVGESDVLVALIGKRWVRGEASGASRLDNTKDYVRLEVSMALARDVAVVPVLVDGMTMPDEGTLPAPVQPITRRNAIEISNTRFNFDVDRLITEVRKILDATEAKRKVEEELLHQPELQQFEKDARPADEANRRRIEQEVPSHWRTLRVGIAISALAIIMLLLGLCGWPKQGHQETLEKPKAPPTALEPQK